MPYSNSTPETPRARTSRSFRRLFACAVSLILSTLSAIYGADAEAPALRIAGLKGPTTMGLCNLIKDSENTSKYEFTMYGAADEIVPLLVRGDLDAAAIPANLAAVLFRRTQGDVTVAAINTLGVLYMVEKGTSIRSAQDLKGKTIWATGRGTTPEYVLRYILSRNGIDPDRDVQIEWASEATEALARVELTDTAVAMLPEPFVTTAMRRVEGLRVALNMTDEWEAVAGSSLVTGVLLARNDVLKRDASAFDTFMADYEKSVALSYTDPEGTASLCEELGIVPSAAIAEEALPRCNIVFITGDEMKTDLVNYYRVLYDANPASVGGAMPDDAFYYNAESSAEQ